MCRELTAAQRRNVIRLNTPAPADDGKVYMYNDATGKMELTAISQFDATSNQDITGSWSFNRPINVKLFAGAPTIPASGHSIYTAVDKQETRLFTSGFRHIYDYGAISATRTLTVPDTSGTIALTSQLPTTTGILKTDAVLGAPMAVVKDYAGTESPLYLSTTQIGIAPTGTAAGTATQKGSRALIFQGSSWDGAAAIAANWSLYQSPDTSQNDYPRFVGDYNGSQFLRIDKSSYVTTYSGIGNTTAGYRAGQNLTALAYNNLMLGGHSGELSTDAYQVVFVGNRCGTKNTTGFQRTHVGQGAGYEGVDSSETASLGFHSHLYPLGGNNSYFGAYAGQGVLNGTASSNTGGGNNTQFKVFNATENASWGRNTMYNLNNGTGNATYGDISQFSLTDGNYNLSGGYKSSYTDTAANALTTGSYNVHLGPFSGFASSTQRNYSVAIGPYAKVNADNTMVLGATDIVAVVVGATATLGTSARLAVKGAASCDIIYFTDSAGTSALNIASDRTINAGGAIAQANDVKHQWGGSGEYITGSAASNYVDIYANAAQAARFTNSNATFGGSITTATPSGSAAKPWKLGNKTAITEAGLTALGFDSQLCVDVDGTVYFFSAKATNAWA